MLEKIEQTKQKNCEAIIKAINELDTINYDTVSRLLPNLLAQGALKLDSSVYKPIDPNTNAVGRFLIYDHEDKLNPFSIWVFALGLKQKTAIHDHKYKGTVTVLNGPVSEKFYKPTGENTAQLVKRIDRYQFHSNKDDLNTLFVHQLKRRKGLGQGTSVTLHIYNMEAYLINEKNEKIDRRNLDTIYFKEKLLDKSNLPAYEEEHLDLNNCPYSI